jgi:hypothetical protein
VRRVLGSCRSTVPEITEVAETSEDAEEKSFMLLRDLLLSALSVFREPADRTDV